MYERSVSVDSGQWKVLCNLGALYHLLGDFSLAWDHYTAAANINPNNHVLQSNMRKLLRAQLVNSN